jgi:transposase-like protein
MIKISYSGYRFPPEIIQHAIWLYLRFTLSFRDVDDLLAERGINGSPAHCSTGLLITSTFWK